jgi:hypothetical protein
MASPHIQSTRARGELELRSARHETAREHFRAALAVARNPMERRLLGSSFNSLRISSRWAEPESECLLLLELMVASVCARTAGIG